MYHRHSNESIRPSRPFEYERNPINYQERISNRTEERPHHQQQQPHHYSNYHPDQRRHPSSYHHDSNPPRTPSSMSNNIEHNRFPPNSDRSHRSQVNTPSRTIDRRIDFPERPLHRPSQHQDHNYQESRRIYDDPRTNHKVYDEQTRETHHSNPATANNHSSNHISNSSTTTTYPHRRAEDLSITNRSTRYNPYPPPTGPRADSHVAPLGRIPHGPSAHPPYHSSSNSLPPAYDDRLPHSRSHDQPPQRTYDPNSQFNHGPPKEKSPPSQSVIFMGLPIHTDEANLRAYLEEAGASVDSVTIIYDRMSGQSKRYGFARFMSVEHARAFVEPAFPIIVWKEPSGSRHDRSGDGLKVKIDYSQKEKVPFEVRQREREMAAPRNTPATPFITEIPNQPGYSYSSSPDPSLPAINDGARDIGGTPTSILLLRGLDPLSTEQEIAQHLQHIPDPSQTVLPESVRKVMLIKDRETKASWGYAFVQFADVQVAVKALSLLLNTSLFPRGFQIRSKTITVTFAHEHSFHPIYTSSDWSFKGAEGQELAYWDEKAYAALYVSNIAEPNHSSPNSKIKSSSQPNQLPDSRNGQHEDADMNELLSSIDAEPQVNSDKQGKSINEENSSKHSSNPQHLNNPQAPTGEKLQPSESRKIETEKLEPKVQTKSKNDAGEGGIHHIETLNPISKGSDGSKNEKKKTSVEPIATKKMVANIQKWQSKHQEIATAVPSDEDKAQPAPPSNENSPVANGDEFSDFTRLTCILCQRQFKSQLDLQRHNSLSNLHKTNLQDDKMKKLARSRKAASLTKKSSTTTTAASTGTTNPPAATTESGTKYTDRAAARREAYGQPDAPNADRHEAKKARYEPAPPPVLPPAQPDKDGIRDTNVGSKMLEKMGWQKGEGLGNGTNGRTDPVVAAQYTKGVGLGASTGVAVGQYEDSKKGFLDQVKDKTVQRFNEE